MNLPHVGSFGFMYFNELSLDCVLMGSFEVFHFWILTLILISTVVGVLSIFSFKNILNRFGLIKSNRREFYECGFKPLVQKPVQFSIQFVMICFFFLIYDIELAFSFPLLSNYSSSSLTELFFFFFLYGTFLISLIFDYDQKLTNWRF